jgi:hypothetical protein
VWDRKAKGKLVIWKNDHLVAKKNDCAASIRTTTPLPTTCALFFLLSHWMSSG